MYGVSKKEKRRKRGNKVENKEKQKRNYEEIL